MKFVALDIDGTLLASGGLTDGVKAAVEDARAAGHQLVVATGRGALASLGICADLNFDGYVVCCNGALTLRVGPGLPGPEYSSTAHGSGYGARLLSASPSYGFEVLSQHPFKPSEAIDAVRAALPEAHLSVTHMAGIRTGPAVTQAFPKTMLFGEQTVVDVDVMKSLDALKLVLFAPTYGLDEIAALTSTMPGVNAVMGWGHWADVMRADVSKALGLEELRVKLGFDSADTVAVGDGMNDVEMLQWATRAVAMGNACEGLKAYASEITDNVEDDGVATVLRSLNHTFTVRFPLG